MKSRMLFAVLSTLAAMPVFAVAAETPVERKSLHIIQTEEAVFPRALRQQGITEGWARIAISVGADGRLLDALPVAYSHKPFADQAVDVLRRWRYEPMLLGGEPVGTQTEIVFNFQAVGVVLDYGVSERYLERFTEGQAAYRPCSLKELDRVPARIQASSPRYPDELARKGIVGHAVVEFYIDESGTVRMPAVVSADFNELGIFAIAAIESWKFEPPTSNNKPVLARVRQSFDFNR